ncbi:MAG: hypothetical protein E7363_01710 [Clostridiales bacterium]|nr:hypothetical protein [Clostridiales bacterium]
MKKRSYGFLCAVENALFTCPFSKCGKLTHTLVKEKLRFYKQHGHAYKANKCKSELNNPNRE